MQGSTAVGLYMGHVGLREAVTRGTQTTVAMGPGAGRGAHVVMTGVSTQEQDKHAGEAEPSQV